MNCETPGVIIVLSYWTYRHLAYLLILGAKYTNFKEHSINYIEPLLEMLQGMLYIANYAKGWYGL
jgi:hypothetical protein